MKSFMSLPRIWTVMSLLLITILLVASGAAAQDPPLDVRVTFYESTFNLDDPNEQITAVITLENSSGASVWTQEGFRELGFHISLRFKGPGPDGPLITATSGGGGGSPTPQVDPPEVAVEELINGWRINMPIAKVRDNYALTQPGQYRVWFIMPFVQYDTNEVDSCDADNDGIADENCVPPGAVVWDGALETQPTYITLTKEVSSVTSDIRATCTEYVFGEGTHPGVTKKPLTGIELRLYKTDDIEAAGISPINHKVYGSIATNDTIPFQTGTATTTPGEYLFDDFGKNEYLLLGYASRVTDFKHLGQLISADDDRWGNNDIVIKLKLMTDNRGKKSPGKSRKVKGSELLIIEPEYVEWTSTEEIYPFAFESLGDWDVEVAVAPPEGFVADQNALSETVTSDLKALQFTITDVGSKWKPTKVKYKVKHKGKTKTIKSKVKVKLSRKLAKKKGVSEWGEGD
ncbi:MAG: hypothetical protein JRI52_05190 [Deltaproteobacteria bacterium]|nr:hypothetical protein [Deltaproteobacteria bacterium]